MPLQSTHSGGQISHGMISLQNAIINGGDFRQSINVHNPELPINVLMRHVAPSAFHNSTNRIDEEEAPLLHPRTRVAVRERVRTWFQRVSHDDGTQASASRKSALWITGAAGAGKTAIVQSLAEELHRQTTLSASFFFKRSDPTRNHARCLIATWAYQICHNSPTEIQQAILRVIESHPLIFECDVFTQFQTVIANPLRGIVDEAYLQRCDTLPVLIIDGLDECIEPNTQRKLLQLVLKAIQQSETPFLFLIASRPEVHIADILGNDPGGKYCVCVDLNLDPRRWGDIQLFLIDELQQCANTHPLRCYLPAGWPSQSSIDTLVTKSSGNFIYASTAVKYITSLKHQPHHRLNNIIHLTPQSHTAFADLDALYTHILQSAEAAYPPQHIIALLLQFPHMSPHAIQAWLSLPQGAVAETLSDMGSLVFMHEDPDRYILVLHASFGDYIFNVSRAGDMYVDKRHLLQQVGMRMMSFIMEQHPRDFFWGSRLLFGAINDLWVCLGNMKIDATLVEFASTNFKIADKLAEIQKYSLKKASEFYEELVVRGMPELLGLLDSSESDHGHQFSSYLRTQFDSMVSSHICASPWTRSRSFEVANIVIWNHKPDEVGNGSSHFLHLFDDINRSIVGSFHYLQELKRFFLNKFATGADNLIARSLFAEAAYFCLDILCSGPKSYTKHRLPVLSHFLQCTRRNHPFKWRRKRLFQVLQNTRLTPTRVFRPTIKGVPDDDLFYFMIPEMGPTEMDARRSKYCVLFLAIMLRCKGYSSPAMWQNALKYRNSLRKYAAYLQLLPRFLRRAGPSDDLIRLCRTCALTAQSQDFARLSRRARAAIWEYLRKWCGPEGVSGARE